MNEILKKISDIVEAYETGQYKDLHVMHRQLNCNIFFLSKEQVKYNVLWNQEYYKHKSTVNAVKARHADITVPELYLCRKIIDTAKGVSIAMGYEIKLN